MAKDVFISLTKEELAFVQDCIGFATAHQSMYALMCNNNKEEAEFLGNVVLLILRKLNEYPDEVCNGAHETIIGPLPESHPYNNLPFKDIIKTIKNKLEGRTKHE